MDKRKLLRRFLIKAVIFYFGWTALFHGYIRPSGYINNFLTLTVANGTKIGGQLLGYDAFVTSEAEKNSPEKIHATVYLNNEPAVLVADACNGLELFALFVGFIVCFPGAVLPKIIFSIGGTLLLFLANIIREIALSFNYLYFRSSFDFNHKYTYAIAVYAIVFLIWRYWLNNYSVLGKKQ